MNREPITPIDGFSADYVAEMLSLVFGKNICNFVLYLEVHDQDTHKGITMASMDSDEEEHFVNRIKNGDGVV